MDTKSLFKLGYGLYVLTSNYDNKDNGCIINTVMQVSDKPVRIAVSVNKSNFTHDMILNSMVFNVSILTTETPFTVFKHFGFQSGRNVDKFAECKEEHRAVNNVLYIPKYANAFIACKVTQTIDLVSHTMFIAEIVDAQVLSDKDSVTYTYYQNNIKPKPQQAAISKKRWICRVCGYIYEGDEVPDDFVCPLCKHRKDDFELLEN